MLLDATQVALCGVLRAHAWNAAEVIIGSPVAGSFWSSKRVTIWVRLTETHWRSGGPRQGRALLE
ncbi:hypothetical protein LYZ77_19905 [Xanthomonas hortorum pv. vitians]|uniref:hypothetical protein n=1 Tax=Xanthomonas hortorum TaxID=56454 RepID=UPI0012A96D47|nr:hypothetical protein [Xanthomonas hortorum]MCE4281187.1 hypothetical protein [Xanthomonas hortorum pv. vitians]MCE4287114.1 hypothetical protein [Xanthomonas hortorum pv. vitians]MCE4289680.1 hypothetical protein [Xanthomonas hortorum pv. vitians]MCE4294036.1 hypothetical protein [Xanthomonas hortorum pv. vitians]MDT7852005.1 hypothetical protein [Xanthomonas hortorum pv. vitians]